MEDFDNDLFKKHMKDFDVESENFHKTFNNTVYYGVGVSF